MTHEPNIANGLWTQTDFYNTLKCLKNNQKKNSLWHIKTIWDSNFHIHKRSLIGMQTHSFVCIMYMVAFGPQLQSRVLATEHLRVILTAASCTITHGDAVLTLQLFELHTHHYTKTSRLITSAYLSCQSKKRKVGFKCYGLKQSGVWIILLLCGKALLLSWDHTIAVLKE